MATVLNSAIWKDEPKDCTPGGCALRGAKLALQPITNAVHVVHGSASCLGHVWASRPTASSASLLHRYSVTTSLGEVDLVLGSSQRLQSLLDRIAGELFPAAIFVYQSCLTAMTGDDLAGECKTASLRFGIPVLAVEASGLAGGKRVGHHLVVRVLCEQVIGSMEPAFSSSADMNLIGEFNVHGEVAELRALLRSFGIRILASIPGDSRYQEIACAHRAHVSLDLCSQSMPQLAEYLHAQYGIPFIRGSIYGVKAFADTLRRLIHALVVRGADPEVEQKANEWLEAEHHKFRNAVKTFHSRLAGKRVMIYAGGVKSWALIEDLQAAGLVIRGVSLHKCSGDDKQLHEVIRRKCHQAGLREWQEEQLEGLLKSGDVDLVLSGGGMKYLAHKYGVPCVEISHERSFSLLGFDGTINLLREIERLVHSPVLSILRNESRAALPGPNAHHATIIPPPAGSINPFALTQPTGAALAMQGVRGCAALIFGSQGCAASGLIFLSRYFGEQIELATVNMNECDLIHGGQGALKKSLAELELLRPELIAVLSTGPMEAQGVSAVALPKAAGEGKAERIFLHTPDFEGSLEQGWGKAAHALVCYALGQHPHRTQQSRRKILILPGAHLSISDLEWLKDAAEDFKLELLIVPDICTALDGHAGERAVVDGGVALSAIEQITACACYLALGEHMRDAANELTSAGMSGHILSAWTGLYHTDEILNEFAHIAGIPVPEKYRVQRQRLLDAMIDHMRELSRIHAVVAAEPDLLRDLCDLLCELGIRKLTAVSPVASPALRALPVDVVYVGDYQVLAAHLHDCNLLLAPDSAQELAQDAGVAHYAIGIHESHHAGLHFRTRIGYQGASAQMFDFVNLWRSHLTRESQTRSLTSSSRAASMIPRLSERAAQSDATA